MELSWLDHKLHCRSNVKVNICRHWEGLVIVIINVKYEVSTIYKIYKMCSSSSSFLLLAFSDFEIPSLTKMQRFSEFYHIVLARQSIHSQMLFPYSDKTLIVLYADFSAKGLNVEVKYNVCTGLYFVASGKIIPWDGSYHFCLISLQACFIWTWNKVNIVEMEPFVGSLIWHAITLLQQW